MSVVIWWVGAVHLIAYALLGTGFAIMAITVKLHMVFKVMGRIIMWHHERGRWKRREIAQEPRP